MLGGGTPATSEPSYWNGKYPWVTSADIHGVREVSPQRYVTKKGIENSTANTVPGRSLLVVTRVGLGKIAISDNEIGFSQDLQGLVQNPENVLPEYTLYYLSFELQQLKYNGRGTTISGITKKQLKDTAYALPPIGEQRRIVRKIEELFSELDKGIESLKTARDKLKVYRQAVLKHAFEGKLTADWRAAHPDRLESPDQLLARIQKEREAQYKQKLKDWRADMKAWEVGGKEGKRPVKPRASAAIGKLDDNELAQLPKLPTGWTWVKLKAVSDISGGLTKNQARKSLAIRMKYLRVANVYANDVRLDDIREIGVSLDEFKKVALKKNDLMIVEGNGSVEQIGRVALWDGSIKSCGHQNHLIRVRLYRSSRAKAVLQFLLSPHGRRLITREASSTSGLHTLSISKVGNLPIPSMLETEAAQISALIDGQFSVIEKTKRELDAQLAKAESLRQSILKKAFSGQLVPQDPDDEPAAVLLARIHDERAAQTKTGRKRRRASAGRAKA